MEKRFTKGGQGNSTELREMGGQLYIWGYGAVFYDGTSRTEYQLDEGLIERINPRAFDRAIRERQDVRGLFNHDSSYIFARTSSGSLKLAVDRRGLRYEAPCDLSNPIHAHVAGALRNRHVNGSSFMFVPRDVGYSRQKGVLYREILDCDLFDIGPVTFPAYEGATSSLSGMPQFPRSDPLLMSLDDEDEDVIAFHHRMQREQLSRLKALVLA